MNWTHDGGDAPSHTDRGVEAPPLAGSGEPSSASGRAPGAADEAHAAGSSPSPGSPGAPSPPAPSPASTPSDTELLETLFELGREVTSVLDVDELLPKIPQLIARLTSFTSFAVYLLDERRGDLRIAYAVGYPDEAVRDFRLKVGEGVVGAAVAEQRPIRVGDITAEPRWRGVVQNVQSGLAVPLRHKGKVLGALNLMSDRRDAFTARDEAMLRQFAAHVAVALVNARLFESEREYAETLETLAEIGRELSAILDLDELLTKIAHLVKRLIDYRTFGVALLNPTTGLLEMKTAISYGDAVAVPPLRLGEGVVGTAALQREPVLVPDVTKDPRYINAVSDVRSELAIPMLVKDRCVGVLDLESPELDAFTKRDVELLTLLAAHAAVAIENARLYESIRENEVRLEKEVRFAQRVQMALLPQELPKKLKNVDVAWHFDPARELGGDLYEFLAPEPNTFIVAVGDVSGKGVPAALYSSFVGEVVRGRAYRRRFIPERSNPGMVLTSLNRILHERGLEEYYCTLCYSVFDFKKRTVTFANSGLPFPLHVSGNRVAQLELPGVPLGSFAESTYDELTLDLQPDNVFVFCSDGIYETFNPAGEEFGWQRVAETALAHRDEPARAIVDAIFAAMQAFRGHPEQSDDQTVVVVKILPSS